MKKAIKLFCILFVFIGVLLSVDIVALASNTVSGQTTAVVHIKQKASTDSKTITKLNKNTKIAINGYTKNWFKVSAEKSGKTYSGYIPRKKAVATKNTILINKDNLGVYIGSAYQLELKSISGKTSYTKQASWSSSDTNILTVKSGKITTKAIGTAKVTVKYKGKTRTCLITVKQQTGNKTIKSKSIKLTSKTTKVLKGATLNLATILSPINSNEKIIWSSSDKKILTVKNGIVTGINAGKATITAKSGTKTAQITIKCLVKAKSIYATNKNVPLAIGYTLKLSNFYSVSPTNANDKITYTSSNPKVANIESGYLIGNKVGSTIVTVNESGKKTSFTVTVHTISQNANEPLDFTKAYSDEYGIDNVSYHPKCLYFADGWNGYKYWITFSPYKSFNDYYENPHILASNDLTNWVEPEGYSNPLSPTPDEYIKGKIYNSDPELVYNTDTKELECWWRYYNTPTNQVILFRKTSLNGIDWSDAEAMLTCNDKTKEDYLSPSLIYEDGIYKMWFVDFRQNYKVGYIEYNWQNSTWINKRFINIKYSVSNLLSWHLGVIHTKKGYEMTLSAFQKGAPNHLEMSLYYTYSKDNINYEVADIMLAPTTSTENFDSRGLYRSTLMYAENKYYLFYSGISKTHGPGGVAVISGTDPFNLK